MRRRSPGGASRVPDVADAAYWKALVPGQRLLPAFCEGADHVVCGGCNAEGRHLPVRSLARLGPRVCERCHLPFFSDLDFFVCVSCLRGLCGLCAEGCFTCLSAFCHGHCRCLCRPGVPEDGLAAACEPPGFWVAGEPASGTRTGEMQCSTTHDLLVRQTFSSTRSAHED